MIQATTIFEPYEQLSMMNLNDQLYVITTEIIEQINKLPIDTSQILVIFEKVRALVRIEESLEILMKQRQELINKEIAEDAAKDLIEDSLGVAPSAELGKSECKKFLKFYGIYKAFRSVIPFLTIQLQEIQNFTEKILVILRESNGQITEDEFQSLQNIQPQLLSLYRNYFDHFHSLNNGVSEGLKMLKSSTLSDIRQSQPALQEIIENIEDRLETCSSFASGLGKSENEFNSYFNKIKNIMNSNKSKKLIGIGLLESSQNFFEARAVDADQLLNASNFTKLDQILSRVVRAIERL